MRWPFRYPGDEFFTNVFGDVVILIEEVKGSAIDLIESMIEEK